MVSDKLNSGHRIHTVNILHIQHKSLFQYTIVNISRNIDELISSSNYSILFIPTAKQTNIHMNGLCLGPS